MSTAPPDFRGMDVRTHLHPEWLACAIRRWFAERSDWHPPYPTDPDWVAADLAAAQLERCHDSAARRLGLP